MAGVLTAAIAAAFAGGVTADPYYEYTTLLLPGNGTNGAQNNTFLDGSTNNFTITRNGNTTQGTFSPFSQTGWGNYFDGTGDYLTVPDNVALRFGTGDFDIEFWYNGIVGPTNSQFVISKFTAGSFPSQMAYVVAVVRNDHPTNPRGISVYLGSTSFLVGSGNIQDNTWYHIAVTRESGSVKVFINGTQVGTTQTITNDITNTSTLCIGASNDASSLVTGYVSNVRIVKGSAVYTGNFTPPTAPLTAISGTSLLTCQSNRFIDASTNNFTITRNGDTRVVAFSPFNPTASWSAATYGGSGYFDGSGDYLETTSSLSLTGDFTIEFWSYQTQVPALTYPAFFTLGDSNLSSGFELQATTTTIYYYSSTVNGSFTVSNPLFTWTHFAVVRSGSSVTIYRNGTSIGSFTKSGTLSGIFYGGAENYISSKTNNPFFGYQSNIRVVNSVVYSGAFTPPSLAPLTTAGSTSAAAYPSTTNVNTSFASSATSLLLNFTNAGIYDATSKNDLETVGNAQISTTQSKWGGSSIYVDGTGDRLFNGISSPLLNLSSGDWTIESWVYFNAVGAYAYVLNIATAPANPSGLVFGINNSSRIYIGNGAVLGTNGNTTLSTGQWYYLAAVKSGSNVTLYVNGTADVTPFAFTPNSGTYLYVGADASAGNQLNAYLQDVRITRYARPITASPTAAFPTL